MEVFGTVGEAKITAFSDQNHDRKQTAVFVIAIQGGQPGQRTSVSSQLANRQARQIQVGL